LAIVHRDRRGSMSAIEEGFAQIRATGVQLATFNLNALEADGRNQVLSGLADVIGDGKVRLLLHSIALGNLKLIAPEAKAEPKAGELLAKKLGLDATQVQAAMDELLAAGDSRFVDVSTPANYSSEQLITEEDMAQTIYNMGTSLLTWTQDLFQRRLFADDARVIGLTSEGNEIAWKGYAAVAAAKCALESVGRAIAREFAPHGIRCNVVQAGVTETKALALIPGSAQLKAAAKKRNPFGRLTCPEDVAGAVALLTTDEARWINGALIRVDGGEHISG
jgi:NAD(P)-dependent dehydrogenase (short-subunit alcohol dehydrogenase family)